MTHSILTATGPDRPGLVDDVSQYLFERGANIEDSRMVNLRGQFAMVVLFAGDPDMHRRVKEQLESFNRQTGLRADLTPIKPRQASGAMAAMPYRLTATAMDQPGLVRQISHLLHDAKINIESLETRLSPAPITGAPMFEMELLLAIPRSTAIGKLRGELELLCNDLNIDWQLSSL